MRGTVQYLLFCAWFISPSIIPSRCRSQQRFLKKYHFPSCFAFFPPVGFPATCSLACLCHSSHPALPEVASGLLVAKSSGHVFNSVLSKFLVAFYIEAIPSCCDCPRSAPVTHFLPRWSLWLLFLLSFGVVVVRSAWEPRLFTSWALPGRPRPLPQSQKEKASSWSSNSSQPSERDRS